MIQSRATALNTTRTRWAASMARSAKTPTRTIPTRIWETGSVVAARAVSAPGDEARAREIERGPDMEAPQWETRADRARGNAAVVAG